MGNRIFRSRLVVATVLGLGALTAGCGGLERPVPPAGTPGEGPEGGSIASDPAAAFERLEEALLRGPTLPIPFRIRAEGAFEAALQGELRLGSGQDASLAARGTFGDDSVALALDVSGGRMVGGSADRRFDQPTPPALRESLALGLTRMGLLHNLARLTAGAPPDGADGTFAGRVQARNHAWRARAGDPPRHGIAFEVWVQGEHTADAVLWLDALGRPIARDQTVRFGGGDMRVREEYPSALSLPAGGP